MFRIESSEFLSEDVPAEAQSQTQPAWQELLSAPSAVATDELDVVIRADDSAGREVRCSACGETFAGGGPTAYADRRPLCDRCVFDHDAQLAMVLAAVSVLRAFAASEPSAADQQAALDLLRFARLYETFAAKHGGARREPQLPMPSA